MDFWIYTIRLLLLFSPIYIANSSPVIFAKKKWLEFLNVPVDLNIKLRNKPLFGAHKTYRGFLVGTILGTVTAILLNLKLDFFDYVWQAALFGILISFGALFGDLVKSFFKRRLNISPGKDWIPLDQVDYILGAIFFSYPIMPLSLWEYCFLISASIVMHIFGNFLKKSIWKSNQRSSIHNSIKR